MSAFRGAAWSHHVRHLPQARSTPFFSQTAVRRVCLAFRPRELSARPDSGGGPPIGADFLKVPVSDFFVSQLPKDLEDLTPCGKHPTASLFVFLHGQHEFHFRLGVFTFTRRGVDKAAPAALLAGVRRPGGLFRGTAIGPCAGLVHGFVSVDRSSHPDRIALLILFKLPRPAASLASRLPCAVATGKNSPLIFRTRAG